MSHLLDRALRALRDAVLRGRPVLWLLLLAVISCSDSDAPPTGPRPLHGVYSLYRAEGQPLPAVIRDGEIPWEEPEVLVPFVTRAHAGTLTLRADGTYEAQVDWTVQVSGITYPERFTDRGIWSRAADDLLFQSNLVENRYFTAMVVDEVLVAMMDVMEEDVREEARLDWRR
jgi:hypothetical protein